MSAYVSVGFSKFYFLILSVNQCVDEVSIPTHVVTDRGHDTALPTVRTAWILRVSNVFRVEIVLISDQFQIVFAEDAGNTLVSPQKKKHTLTVARPDSAETVFNQRDILGEPGERNPAFAVDYLSCASKTENCGKREEERTLDCSFVTYLQNKTTAEEKGCFFLHIQREKMDLFIWLCGCLLAFLLPSAVKTEEGGKFDTFAARSNHSVTRRC